MNYMGDVHDVREKVAEMAAGSPSKSTGAIAAELGVSERDVMKNLPGDMVREVSREHFDAIVDEVSTWGTMTVIVQNESTILEVKASFPKGTYGHGYFNLKSDGTPVGGHIRASELAEIFFVSRPYMGLESHSIQFFNGKGNAMFKLFLGRNEQRQIFPEQKEKFLALRDRLQ
ncbi:MAG: heme utilization cystosolic carrier protein HutX [Alphaproteobacteria bacterium]|uniref:Heme utilization cystosolic carrier protein HutX n=1 Tax=Candidatus Nitrobium versatile TaxID=2884831 RepID=A0A953M2N0_9BACT|nr:heme utilization cystosolic carrier protein HutX [Candidatus Nitrobium versatile]